jgi:predicted DNA-binding transcriptional regulator AlpA
MAIVKLLRYPDLVTAGVVANRVTLGRLIKNQQFPPGRLLGPNTRAWTETEVEQWLASRPIVRAPDVTPRERRFTAAASKALGQNTRVWPEGEVKAWLASRPTVREPDARERRFTAAAAKAKAGTVKTKRQRRARR